MRYSLQNYYSVLIPAGLCAIFLALALPNINYPSELYFDEIYYVPIARELLSGEGYRETFHPPLGKLLLTASILLLGDLPLSWRLPSLISGAGVIVALYFIALRLSGKLWPAVIAALLLITDCLSFTQSRLAIFNAPMLFFMMLALSVLLPLKGRPLSTSRLVVAGLIWGGAIGIRWVALSAFPSLVLLIYFSSQESRDNLKLRRTMYDSAIVAGWAIVAYVSICAVSLACSQLNPLDVIEFNVEMFTTHWGNLQITNRYASPWWSWPLLLRLVWYGFETRTVVNGGGELEASSTLIIGNPVTFWLIPLFLIAALWVWQMKRDRVVSFCLLGFFSQWLQWAWVPQNTLFHYFYTALPFLNLLIAALLCRIYCLGKWQRIFVCAYGALVVAMFIFWFPLLNGTWIPYWYWECHIWFSRWL